MRWTTTALFCLGLALGSVPAAAQSAAGDADAVRKAANSFDEGGAAYRDGRFELAASHFEAADEAVPSARAVRMAMRARLEAKQYARALTHAAQALARYPDDDKTKTMAIDLIGQHKDKLHRVDVTCSSPCVLAVETRIVPGLPRDAWVAYIEPGKVTLGASFMDGSGAEKQPVVATAGGKSSLRFEPRKVAPEPVEPRPQPEGGASGDGASGAGEGSAGGSGQGEGSQGDGSQGDGSSSGGAGGGGDDGGGSFITHPGVFIGLAVATAGLGGATVWSGIDTLNNPGTDTVREACRGLGPECPEYQQGRDAQLRTNILIGATAGVGALATVFAIFVTDWGGGEDEAADGTALLLRPEFMVSPAGGSVGLSGRF